MIETDRERHARWFLRALNVKGELHFPPQGWPSWSEDEHDRKRDELRDTIEDVAETVPLNVEERADGEIVVRPLAALN